ncbi:MAG: CrcB family protein, partial [Flavobacteriaceae bacterium]|nr:CrcB family protein [Flavobacteriaceae bacterium]
AYSLLAIGFCGGFTTFSAFSMENVHLLQQGHWLQFTLYACGSVLLGILGFLLGFWLMKAT